MESPRTISRRGALASAALAMTSLRGARASQDDPSSDPLDGERLYADVVRYCAFGDHRTATSIDHATGRWLADELTSLGYRAELHPFELRQFFVDTARLAVGDEPIDCYPMWPPCGTNGTPVTGSLARVRDPRNLASGSLAGKIAVVDVPTTGASITPTTGHIEIVDSLRAAGAAAIVAHTPHPSGDLVALNSMRGDTPWGVPIMQVGSKDIPALERAAAAGARGEMTIEVRDEPRAVAYEVTGRIERGPKLVVVTTPYSGWFACAGERGGGVALWLGLARWAAARQDDTSYLFVASSGHELAGAGIKQFMATHPPDKSRVHNWLHLGAGIATYEYATGDGPPRRTDRVSRLRRLQTNIRSAPEMLNRHFANVGLKAAYEASPGGEMVLMARMGYPVWGFAGGSFFHHQRRDTPERITGPELLEPAARATAAALAEMTAGKPS